METKGAGWVKCRTPIQTMADAKIQRDAIRNFSVQSDFSMRLPLRSRFSYLSPMRSPKLARYLGFFAAFTLSIAAQAAPATQEVAVFAGGCFWCMQPPYDHLKSEGVLKTTVGYTGGKKENPTYSEVSEGSTGHREAIEVVFDPKRITYAKLLQVFWHNVDPVDPAGEFCDKGEQYTSAIYYQNEAQKAEAEKSKVQAATELKIKQPITTAIIQAGKFFPGEDYHQEYYTKNPIRYKFYRFNCGRDARLKAVWGELSGGH